MKHFPKETHFPSLTRLQFYLALKRSEFSGPGMHLGKKIGSAPRMSRYAEALGGVVLLLIGFNILREHGALEFLF